MTQHEHGPWQDEHEPTGYTAAVAALLFGAAIIILVAVLVVGA